MLKIIQIFMPYAWKQIVASRFGPEDKEEPIRLVHYTSADAALKIIQTKSLWMRNTNCMTDYMEVQHGFDLVADAFTDEKRRAAFESAMNSCHDHSIDQVMDIFHNHRFKMRFSSYVTSFSEHKETDDKYGRLSMWRAFGGSTARVAIVFRIPKYSSGPEALKVLFSPVAYLSEVGTVMEEITANVEKERKFLRSTA